MSEDRIDVQRNVTWEDYKRALETRGDHSPPRIAYADGCLQIMSPSREHEAIKSMIGHLVTVFCLERDIDFRIFGSWTLEAETVEKAVEPDDCFVFGPATAPMTSKEGAPTRPDLVIEVVWTSGGISKLDIYRAIGVREVWFWQRGVITPYELRDGDYVEVPSSQVLPGIDLVQLVSYLDRPTLSAAMREYRDALRR